MKYGNYKTLEQFLSTTLRQKILVKTAEVENIYDVIKSINIIDIKDENLNFMIKTKEKGDYKVTLPFTGSIYEGQDSFVIMPYLLFLFPTELDEEPYIGEKIEVQNFANTVKCGGFIDSDGYGDVITKDGIFYDMNLNVNELASLAYHPDVTHIMWYNK